MKNLIAAAMLSSVFIGAAARAVDNAPPTSQPANPAKPMVLMVRTNGGSSTSQPAVVMLRDVNGTLGPDNVTFRAAVAAKTEKAAWMGVSTSRAPLSLTKQMKLKSGVVVDEVKPDSPAAAAGLKAQDLIEKLDDQLLMNPSQLESLIRMHNPGDSVTLTILHEGDRSTVTAKLVEHDVLVMQDGGPQVIGAFPLGPPGGNTGPMVVTPDDQAHTHIMTFGRGDGGGGPNGVGSSSFQSQFNDGTHELTISGHDGHKTLVIKDSAGKELFNGPIDTPEQQDAIPQDLLPKFQQMQKMSNMTDKLPAP
jgi:membrane-associated protease RseP (regulator of RpoE activity)